MDMEYGGFDNYKPTDSQVKIENTEIEGSTSREDSSKKFSFGFKVIPKKTNHKGNKQNKIGYEKVHLTNTTNGHDKFYKMKLEYIPTREYEVIINYGSNKIRGLGTVISKVFSTENAAQKFITTQVREKLKKGYISLTT